MRRLPRLLALAGLAATAACSGGSGSATSTTIYAPLQGRVVVVGDSLTVGTQPNLEKLAERHGFDLDVSAVSGRQIPESLADIERLTPGADVVVIALGTNDAAQPGFDGAVAAERINTALDAVPGEVPILWVDVYREPGTPAGDAAEVFNVALDDAEEDDPRLDVLAWTEFVADQPEVMDADGVHNTPDGYVARSRWLRDALVPLLTPEPTTSG